MIKNTDSLQSKLNRFSLHFKVKALIQTMTFIMFILKFELLSELLVIVVFVCFQAQIDHYLALVNNQIKDVVGK